MQRSIDKQSGESVESLLKKKNEGCGGKDLQKRKVQFTIARTVKHLPLHEVRQCMCTLSQLATMI